MSDKITLKKINELKKELFKYQLFHKESLKNINQNELNFIYTPPEDKMQNDSVLITKKIPNTFLDKVFSTLDNMYILLNSEIKNLNDDIYNIDNCNNYNSLLSIAKKNHISISFDKNINIKYNIENLKNILISELKYKTTLSQNINSLYHGYNKNINTNYKTTSNFLNLVWKYLDEFQNTSNNLGFSYYSCGKTKLDEAYMFNTLVNLDWSLNDIDSLKYEIYKNKNIRDLYNFYTLLNTYADYANIDYNDLSNLYIEPRKRLQLKNKYYPLILESIANTHNTFNISFLSKEDLKTIAYFKKINTSNWHESNKIKLMQTIYNKSDIYIKEFIDFYNNKAYAKYHDKFYSKNDITNIVDFYSDKKYSSYYKLEPSSKQINKILDFFNLYKIEFNPNVHWSLDTIDKINTSIKNYIIENNTSSNNIYSKRHKFNLAFRAERKKLHDFYNTFKQYQGHFIDIKNVDYMKNFMEKYPMYKYSLISFNDMIAINEEKQLLKNEQTKITNKNISTSSEIKEFLDMKNTIEYYKKNKEPIPQSIRFKISHFLLDASKTLSSEISKLEMASYEIKKCDSMTSLISIAKNCKISDIHPLYKLDVEKKHLNSLIINEIGHHKKLLDMYSKINIDFDKKKKSTLSDIYNFLDEYEKTAIVLKRENIDLNLYNEFITNPKYSYYKNHSLSNDEILEVVSFFNAIPIEEKTHEWELSTIRKINASIKSSTMKYDENNKLVYENISKKRKKLSDFYNTYKQYRGSFVNVEYVDYMDNFMKKNPNLKHLLITVEEMSSIDELPLSVRKKGIKNLFNEKNTTRLHKLRSKIKSIINRLSVKVLIHKVFKRKHPEVKLEKLSKIEKNKSISIKNDSY